MCVFLFSGDVVRRPTLTVNPRAKNLCAIGVCEGTSGFVCDQIL